MEELGGGRGVHDTDVVLRSQLQKTLQSCARVLGAVPLVAVREEQREP